MHIEGILWIFIELHGPLSNSLHKRISRGKKVIQVVLFDVLFDILSKALRRIWSTEPLFAVISL